jgi:glycosyltransferase involved in cell wall biosynthesis
MRLSAIVPTHDRPAALRRCLETLRAQEIAADRLEVIVVDDGSSADVAGVASSVAASGPIAMRCERQSLSGLNGARNRGAEIASGELLAFLDDDTLVSPGWASALVDAFDRHPCAAVGGRVELELAAPAPAWLARQRHWLAEYDLGDDAHWVSEHERLPVGANCAVRRTSFEQAGGFHLGLDRVAGSLISNGDTEFFLRLRDAGGKLRYEPRARVRHSVPAERLTVAFFNQRNRAQGVSDELLFRLRGGVTTPGYRLLLARGAMHAARLFLTDPLRGRGTTQARFWANYWAGRIGAVRRLSDYESVLSSPPQRATTR